MSPLYLLTLISELTLFVLMTLTFLARQPEDVTVLPDSAPRLLPLPGPYNSAGHLQPAYHQVSVSVFSCFLMHFFVLW